MKHSIILIFLLFSTLVNTEFWQKLVFVDYDDTK